MAKLSKGEDNIINGVVDIREDELALINDGKILRELLTDQTRKKALLTERGEDTDVKAYIYWATSDYENLGPGYSAHDEIRPELITGEERGKVIMPRVLKDKIQQVARAKDKAEVFTPSWVCNAQNNLVDEAWSGQKNLFNEEIIDENGAHSWKTTEKVDFSGTGKTWVDYVKDIRMEITCGEAPYLVSRYDTTTGQFIPVKDRVGLLDRKLRVVSENAANKEEWIKYAVIAFKSIYGYEWQGDNLLLAREALFRTFADYYKAYFGETTQIHTNTLQCIANVISWNLWQMDGLKFVIPESCHEEVTSAGNLFDPTEVVRKPCEGCEKGDNNRHNGTYPLVRDWTLYENYHADKEGVIGRERSDIPFNKLCK